MSTWTNPLVEAVALAERIKAALCEPFDLGDHRVTVGTSIGIAVAPRDGTDSDEILKKADLALYSAKNGGRGSFRFFEPELDELMHARRNLERDMRSALANDEFELRYQPIVNFKSGKIGGFEALLRWHHPAARLGHARRLYPACGRNRLDRADRRVGTADGVRGGGKMAGPSQDRNKSVSGSIQKQGSGSGHCQRPGEFGNCANKGLSSR